MLPVVEEAALELDDARREVGERVELEPEPRARHRDAHRSSADVARRDVDRAGDERRVAEVLRRVEDRERAAADAADARGLPIGG
ncbi:MAG: hypothetical protein IPJ77_21035 [Planctomycetes bacterium]|nr:hypothetical protein [Planctomycetota bacterium]